LARATFRDATCFCVQAASGLWSLFDRSRIFSLVAVSEDKPISPPPSSNTGSLSPADDQFLDELEKLNFQFFWEQASPQTGLVKDRSNVQTNNNSVVGSIAATGFGPDRPLHRAKTWIHSPCRGTRPGSCHSGASSGKKCPTHRGFFYHFADINTGERVWDSEVSSVDTAILLCGILTCRQHFEEHSEISLLAYQIFNRVDWSWLSEDTSLLPHGWTPRTRLSALSLGLLQ